MNEERIVQKIYEIKGMDRIKEGLGKMLNPDGIPLHPEMTGTFSVRDISYCIEREIHRNKTDIEYLRKHGVDLISADLRGCDFTL